MGKDGSPDGGPNTVQVSQRTTHSKESFTPRRIWMEQGKTVRRREGKTEVALRTLTRTHMGAGPVVTLPLGKQRTPERV